jgi:hypothetical protein
MIFDPLLLMFCLAPTAREAPLLALLTAAPKRKLSLQSPVLRLWLRGCYQNQRKAAHTDTGA